MYANQPSPQMSVCKQLETLLDASHISHDARYAATYLQTQCCIGKGSYGSVFASYHAIASGVWVRVAVKEIDLRESPSIGDVAARISETGREAYFMSMPHICTSRHVVRAYCPWLDCHRRTICLPQELCDESLWGYHRRLLPAGIPGEILCSLLHQCLTALADLERGGVVHNDIKPHNILLVWPSGRDVGVPCVKLADFGLSSLSVEIVDQVEPNPVGTPYYMAPETINTSGRGAPHARDVWSLGCTFFELIAGVIPFAGDTLAEIHERAANGNPVMGRHRKRAGELHSKLCSLVQTMFTLSPDERPTPGSLQQNLSTLCTNIDFPQPKEARNRTYARYTVCRPHLLLPVFNQPAANVAFATGKTLYSGNNNIIAETLPPLSRGCTSGNLPRLFSRLGSRSPGERTLNCGGGAGPSSERAQTVPTMAPCLSRQSGWSPPPPPPTSAWVHVVFPFEGYCQQVLGGQHVLHRYEDMPANCCPPLGSGNSLDAARTAPATARAFPPAPLLNVFECDDSEPTATPLGGGAADSPPARCPPPRTAVESSAPKPKSWSRLRSLFSRKPKSHG